MNIEDINIHIMFSSTSPSYLLLFFYPGYVRLEVKMNNRNGEKSSKQFDLQDRFEIEMGLIQGLSFKEIAKRLDCHPISISREIRSNRTS